MSVQEKPLHIDIPVKLAEVKNVWSIASLSFEGDLPGSIFHLQLIMNDIANWKAKSQVVVVFHTNAGHPTLHDQAYNADRTSRELARNMSGYAANQDLRPPFRSIGNELEPSLKCERV